MRDKNLRRFLGLKGEYGVLFSGDSGCLPSFIKRITALEQKLNTLFNYLDLWYQTDCSERLPQIKKTKGGGK